jgi:hypothetical protein
MRPGRGSAAGGGVRGSDAILHTGHPNDAYDAYAIIHLAGYQE